ncbi:MAG: UDP-N-acetylglucosamine 2-epimerase, partial [Culicoidibacterales bacterium]
LKDQQKQAMLAKDKARLGAIRLLMRDTTERPEGVAAGTLKLVGTNEATIYQEFKTLLTDESAYAAMSQAANPYGDGTASEQIAEAIATYFASLSNQ